ncbi:MAG: hypothetical protein GW855_07765 [Erythrobacter sp.]|nr:hypothetical protein [Erythrobacter sp.]
MSLRDIIADIDDAPTERRATPPRPPVRHAPAQRSPQAPLPRRSQEIPFHLRQRNIEGATAHLKRHGILVDVVDRDALVRRYRVTGRAELQLKEGVVEIACAHGFEVIR